MDNESTINKKATPNVQAAARAVRARLSLRRGIAELASDLVLALGTLLVLFGLFMAWQAWLAARQTDAAQTLVQARQDVAQKIGLIVADRRAQVTKALTQPALVAQLAANDDAQTRDAAAQRIKAELQDADAVTLYSAQLNEVLHGNLQQLGYARAAQLMSSLNDQDVGRAQSPQAKRLSFAGPIVGTDGKVLAYATIDFHDTAVRIALHSARIPAGRLELKQSNKSGDIMLDSVGESSLPVADQAGVSVAHSLYRITSTPPSFWLPVTRSFTAAAILAVIAFLIGVALLWMRPRLRARLGGAPIHDEPVLSDVIAAAPPTPKPETPVKSAATAAVAPSVAAHEGAIPDRGIFRAYDIRGVIGQTLTEGVAHQLGRAIGSAVRDKELSEIVVGRDGRLSGPELSGALIDGLRAAGVDVIDIGAVPTPVSYFAAYQLNTGSCVSVTGSHNPPDYNGFKIVLGGETLAEDAIQKLYQRIADKDFATGTGQLEKRNLNADYIERIASDVRLHRPLKIVVDCGNGIPGAIAPQLFERLGADVVPLFCEVDGNFPNHHPDPSDLHNLEDLILTVKQIKADLGIAFDGDGDRLGVVTPAGEVIFPDRTLMLFARDVLTRNKGATIIYDVKCTGKLAPVIEKAGGVPLMWRTGHSLIKGKMRETGAALAGEMSGHFFFKERWYGFDDGLYAGARLLEILSGDAQQRSPQAIFEELPNSVSTPELKIELTEGEHYKFIERFQREAKFEGAKINTIDGVRADWPDGWGLVRASNTTPVLVLRFDAESMEALKRVQNLFRAQLLAINPKLKLPF